MFGIIISVIVLITMGYLILKNGDAANLLI